MVLYPFTNKDINIDSKSIHISNGLYKNTNSFSLIKLNTIESIEIGNDCFSNANLFKIDGLNHLKSLKIGKNSFTTQKANWKIVNTDCSRSFQVLNCVELKSIEIGEYSFSGYSGKFELSNLPSLYSIKIGSMEMDCPNSDFIGRSFNFFGSSFVIKGIIDIVIANK